MGEQLAEILVLASLLVSLATGMKLLSRFQRQGQILPYEVGRRPSWSGVEVLVVFFLFHWGVILGIVLDYLVGDSPPPSPAESALSQTVAVMDSKPAFREDCSWRRDDPSASERDELAVHPVFLLLQADPSLGTVLWCSAVVVVLAPVVEEVIFRLVLLGYFAERERRWRRRVRFLRGFLPGLIPVVGISIWFALLHGRSAEEIPAVEEVRQAMNFTAQLGIVTLLAVMIMAAGKRGGFLANMGVDLRKLGYDLKVGALACVVVTPPLWLLQAQLTRLLAPLGWVPDPVPIYFLAVVLGMLYYRTGRVVASVVLHVLHNLASFLLALLPIFLK